MKYLLFDLETSGYKTNKRFSNPLDPTNEITLAGWKHSGKEYEYIYQESGIDRERVANNLCLNQVDVIVGHNLKFDLLWIFSETNVRNFIARGGILWDTLTVQYLIDGQQKIPRSLDDLALKYGGTLKNDVMKQHYKEGGLSKTADKDTLIEYNKEDINNTLLIFKKQVEICKKRGLIDIVKVYMSHYRAVIEMEYNGMYMNLEELKKRSQELTIKKDALEKELIDFADKHEYSGFNPASLDHLSLFLFGGCKKIKQKLPCYDDNGALIFIKKTGLKKEKLQEVIIEKKAILPTRCLIGLSKNKKGYYVLDLEVIEGLLKNKLDDYINVFINNLLAYRKVVKLLSTYYKGLLDCTSSYTKCVHPEFKTSSTYTGRLSCTNPNAQNLHPDVLAAFTSRYGNDGILIEIDYDALEVRLQAYLSDCKNMITDINNNIDFHTLRMSYAEQIPYKQAKELVDTDHEWAMKRKHIGKPISFGKAYGASPERISINSGLPIETVKKVFNAEDLRYPEVKGLYENIHKNLTKSRTVSVDLQEIKDKLTGTYKTRLDEQQGWSVYKSITGKEYVFKERAVFTKTGQVFRYFYMPEIQDYPIQGMAGDFVAMQVGRLYDWLIDSKVKCRLINEIHDAVLLDCHKDFLTSVLKYAKLILEDTKEFENLTGKKFEIEMPVDIKMGHNWKEIKDE